MLTLLFVFAVGGGGFLNQKVHWFGLRLPIAFLISLAFTTSFSSALTFFSVQDQASWQVIGFCLFLTVSIIYGGRFQISMIRELFSSKVFVSTLIGFFGLLTQNRSFTDAGYSIRNGPDILGWLGSSKYLCEGQTLRNLTDSIMTQTNNQNISSLFEYPRPAGLLSITQIPSFRDQIAGEFLIGASRIGLPSFQSSLCSIYDVDSILRMNSALIGCSFFLLAFITMRIAENLKLNKALIFTSPLLVLSIAILGPTLEGGLGALVLSPAILLFISTFCFDEFERLKLLSTILIVTLSLTIYFDTILQAIFLVGTLTLFRAIRKKDFSQSLDDVKLLIKGGTLGLIIGVLFIDDLWRLLLARLSSQSFGGWNQGRPPTPLEFIGLINWLPAEGYGPTPRNWLFLLTLVVLSLCLAIFAILHTDKTKDLLFVIAFFYVVLFVLVYIIGRDQVNNYIIFKGGMLAAIISIPVILEVLSKVSKEKTDHFTSNFGTKIGVFVVFISLTSTTTYLVDWANHSSTFKTLSPSVEFQEVIDMYDLDVVGLYAAQLTLYGDVHYGSNSRSFNFPVLESNPRREKVVVFPAGSGCEVKCKFYKLQTKNYSFIYQDSYMDVVKFE
jgi:hypothetical protein